MPANKDNKYLSISVNVSSSKNLCKHLRLPTTNVIFFVDLDFIKWKLSRNFLDSSTLYVTLVRPPLRTIRFFLFILCSFCGIVSYRLSSSLSCSARAFTTELRRRIFRTTVGKKPSSESVSDMMLPLCFTGAKISPLYSGVLAAPQRWMNFYPLGIYKFRCWRRIVLFFCRYFVFLLFCSSPWFSLQASESQSVFLYLCV